jgi:cathepsin B
MGGSVHGPWSYVRTSGVVSGQQNENDTDALAAGLPPSDPFYEQGFCAPFSLPHCHHHGDQGADPYPAEGDPGCPSQRSPLGPSECAASSVGDHAVFAADKYTFDGLVQVYTAKGLGGRSLYFPKKTS